MLDMVTGNEHLSFRVMLFYDWLQTSLDKHIYKHELNVFHRSTKLLVSIFLSHLCRSRRCGARMLWGTNAVVDSWASFSTESKNLLEALHSIPNLLFCPAIHMNLLPSSISKCMGLDVRSASSPQVCCSSIIRFV